MFKLYNSPELDTLHTFPTIASIFDPRVNKGYKIGRNMSLGEYWKLTESIWTRDHITKAPHQFFRDLFEFFPSYKNNNYELFKEFIKDIPDEHIPGFQYFRFSGTYRDQMKFVAYTPRLSRSGTSYAVLADETTVTLHPSIVAEEVSKHYVKVSEYIQTNRHQPIDIANVFEWNYLTLTITRFYGQRTTVIFNGDGTNISSLPELDAETTVEVSPSEADILRGDSFSIIITRKVSKNYRDPLFKKLSYSTNPLTLLNWPLKEKDEHSPVLYGVELESSFDYEIKDLILAQYEPFFIAKDDSTITGSKRHRAELVTIPMSLKAHKRHWAHWFKNIDYSRFDTTKDTNNGCHVHIDRKAFDDEKHIRNMTWFYLNPANRDFLVYVSERGSIESMRQYSPIITFPSSTSKVSAFKKCVTFAGNARGIVNFNKRPTIEIRMFRGIASFAELVKNLEFVDAVLTFSRGEHNMNTLNLPDFLRFLKSTNNNRYTTLKEFLLRCKTLNTMIETCELQSVVFNETDPMKVLELINKAGLQINNHHVTYLNRGRKRTYTIDKKTMKLQIVEANRSRLADLDRSIEAKYTRQEFAA